MRIKALITLNFLIMMLLVGLTCIFISMFGISGVGYAMIGTFSIIDIVIICLSIKWGWLSINVEEKKPNAD
jgi:hypothetical protein